MLENLGFRVLGTLTTELSEYGATGIDTHVSMKIEYDILVGDDSHQQLERVG